MDLNFRISYMWNGGERKELRKKGKKGVKENEKKKEERIL